MLLSKVRSKCLVNQMQGATMPPWWMQQVEYKTRTALFVTLACLPLSQSLCVCLPASPDNDQIHFQAPSPRLPHCLTGPHKQGHLGGCKRKMYHLLGNGWHDVLAKKAFILSSSIAVALFPLPSSLIDQRGRRQLPLELQRKLPLQYGRKYPTNCWKIAVFAQQPGLRGLKTDWVNWRQTSLMTLSDQWCKGQETSSHFSRLVLDNQVVLLRWLNLNKSLSRFS